MKLSLLFALSLGLAGCATGPDRPPERERCMMQDFGTRKFKIVKVDGLSIHVVDLKTGEKMVISKLAHGWSEGPCR